MFTNNQYYKKILEKLTSTTISGNHTDNYYIRRIAQEYGVEDTNKCNGRLLKAIAEIIAETTFNDFHFINFYLKKIAETLSEQTFPTVHSDNYYLGVFCEYCVEMPYNDISAWTGDSIISYNGGTDPESATLSAQLLKGGNPASVEDVTITFKVSKKGTSDVVTTLTADTGSDGKATVSYTARGLGDLCVETKIEGTSLIQTYELEDCLQVPKLDGSEDITSWTSMTNKTENGIYYSHGSFLTQGWSNAGLWQLDFDVMTTNWRYVGLMPICSEEINPYTDAKITNYAMTCWEGLNYMGGLGASVVSEDSLSKITSTNIWHHVTIKKLSATQVEIIINNTYHSIRNVPNLANLTTLHIGTRDNPSSRNYGGIIQYKNIKIKSL